jgi:cyclopropane fatty-acyl-phospholipid synthase-like methyltransferase
MDKDKFDRYLKLALSTVYAEPDTPNFHTPIIHQAVDTFVPEMNLAKDAHILDIGCGQGAFMKYMVQKGFDNMIGVTLSIEDAEACQTEGFETLCCDFSDLKLSDGSVDMIWCRHALEHSPYPMFSLMEFNRLLKVDGNLYVELPAPNLDGRRHEDNPNHYSVLGDRMWISLFLKTGFRINQYRQMQFHVKQEDREMDELFYCFVLQKDKSLLCSQ